MTGYGVHTYEDDTVSIPVEVKSLNSKQTDLNVRLPRIVNDKELEIRNQVAKALGRGKVSVMIDVARERFKFRKIFSIIPYIKSFFIFR